MRKEKIGEYIKYMDNFENQSEFVDFAVNIDIIGYNSLI